jgi:hypothetical protein
MLANVLQKNAVASILFYFLHEGLLLFVVAAVSLLIARF